MREILEDAIKHQILRHAVEKIFPVPRPVTDATMSVHLISHGQVSQMLKIKIHERET
jgi:hypothetical protein